MRVAPHGNDTLVRKPAHARRAERQRIWYHVYVVQFGPCLPVGLRQHHKSAQTPQMRHETMAPQPCENTLQRVCVRGIEVAVVGPVDMHLAYLHAAVRYGIDKVYLPTEQAHSNIGPQPHQFGRQLAAELTLLAQVYRYLLHKRTTPQLLETDVEIHHFNLVGKRIEQRLAATLGQYYGYVIAVVLGKIAGLERQHTLHTARHIQCGGAIYYPVSSVSTLLQRQP